MILSISSPLRVPRETELRAPAGDQHVVLDPNPEILSPEGRSPARPSDHSGLESVHPRPHIVDVHPQPMG